MKIAEWLTIKITLGVVNEFEKTIMNFERITKYSNNNGIS